MKHWSFGRGAAARSLSVSSEDSLSPSWASSAASPITHFAVSNDSGYTGSKMWGMYGDGTSPRNSYGSGAGEAWAAGHVGSMKVAVGVVDTGIDYTHPDLYLNIWLNHAEIPTSFRGRLIDADADSVITFRDLNSSRNAAYVSDLNANGRIDAGDLLADTRWENGADEDGNGYRDDLIGWDFVNNDNDPRDDNGHGTHIAGTIGAMGGNGAGVAGVNWNVQMVALKFMNASSSGSTSDAIEAIDYFTNASKNSNGVDFVATNNSWGGSSYNTALLDAIARGAAEDILFVAAAGNGGSDRIGDNNDSIANHPSNYDTRSKAGYDAVVAVASIMSNGGLSTYSNYGRATVDIGAPGSGIYSTTKGGSYGTMSGTSMATPHVTGAIALYAAANPDASAAEIKADLLSSAAATTSLTGKTVTGGRLDIPAFLALGDGEPDGGGTGGSTVNGTSGNDTLNGTSIADTLNGLAGNDKLNGLAGGDRMAGGAGNDTFYVDSTSDQAVEASGEGFDSVRTSGVSYTLPANVERLYLDGTANLSGTGNGSSNHIHGNSGANTLRGMGGNDALWGNSGNDRLEGGDGNDVLTGGAGADTLLGGTGRDRFDWDKASDAAGDKILDFAQGSDKLDLSSIDARTGTSTNDAFSFLGSGAFSGSAGQLRYQKVDTSGVDYTLVQGDLNGDRVADFEFRIEGSLVTLQAADFVL